MVMRHKWRSGACVTTGSHAGLHRHRGRFIVLKYVLLFFFRKNMNNALIYVRLNAIFFCIFIVVCYKALMVMILRLVLLPHPLIVAFNGQPPMIRRKSISSIHPRLNRDPNRRMSRSAAKVRAGIFAVACGVGIMLAVPAKADTLNVTRVTVPLYASAINVSYGGTTWSGIIAGQLVLHSTDSAMPTMPAFDVVAWCVDLFHDINIGNASYAFNIGTSVTTDGNGGTVLAATNAKLMTLGAYGNSLLAGPNAGNADVSSAIQLAIWQTEYSGLTFVANGVVTADVATYVSYANNHTLTGSALGPLNGQQQLITNSVAPGGIPGSSNANAPEPISSGLLATGLIGLGFVRRRKR
jgi:hypothetical protein